MLLFQNAKVLTSPAGASQNTFDGPEVLAKALSQWLASLGTRPLYTERNSLSENGYCESSTSFIARPLGRDLQAGTGCCERYLFDEAFAVPLAGMLPALRVSYFRCDGATSLRASGAR
jgi:hypothetical protein